MKINLSAKISFFAAALTFFTASAVGYMVYRGASELSVDKSLEHIIDKLEQLR